MSNTHFHRPSYFILSIALALVLLILACGSGSGLSSTKTPSPISTVQPVSEGTPLPSKGEVISANNINQLVQLARISCGGFVSDVDWSPSGDLLAVAADKQTCLYELPALKQVGVLAASTNIAFSADGESLLSIERVFGNDFLINIWSVKSRKLERKIKLTKNLLENVQVSPNGEFIATSGSTFGDKNNTDSSVYNFDSGKLAYNLPASTEVIFSPDSNLIAVNGGPSGISILKSKDGQKVNDVECSNPSRLSFNAAGNLLAAACMARISIWSITEGKEASQIDIERSIEIEGMYFSRNGNLLFIASDVWAGTYTFNGNKKGKYVNWRDYADPLIIWSIDKQEPLRIVNTANEFGEINDITASPDDTLIAIGTGDIVQIWGILDVKKQ